MTEIFMDIWTPVMGKCKKVKLKKIQSFQNIPPRILINAPLYISFKPYSPHRPAIKNNMLL